VSNAIVSTAARVTLPDGRLAATIDEVPVGGGTQVKTVDGEKVETVHDSSKVYHLRLISLDRSVPDELREFSDYDEAVAAGVAYADRLEQSAAQALADLKA